jgi:hypothetical protein
VIHCLRGRVLKPELLDSLPEQAARASLSDLVRINRDWGGHSTLRRLLTPLVRRNETFSLLDVGAASGDMGDCVRANYRGARVTSLDYRLSHLRENSGPSIVGDAFARPLIDLVPVFAAHTVAGAQIALAGVLAEQAEEVITAYAAEFEMRIEAVAEGWALLAGARR